MDKLQECVLVIPKEELSSIKKGSSIESIINHHGKYLVRSNAEENPNFLQIIPYVVIINNAPTIDKDKKSYPEVFAYKRLKAGTEARLHSKYSVGIGGHIEQSRDSIEGMDHWSAVLHGCMRELNEEVKIGPGLSDVKHLSKVDGAIIYDDSNAVGQVHLGVVFLYDTPYSSVTPKETEKISGSMMSLESLKTSGLNFENWTKEVFKII